MVVVLGEWDKLMEDSYEQLHSIKVVHIHPLFIGKYLDSFHDLFQTLRK